MQAALAPEDDGYVTTRVEGATLVVEAEAKTAASLLRSLDDALVCLQAAHKGARVAAGPGDASSL